jgi:2-amino-4-hydroxy-6-hydroxymethyldihydropteridine diphosphokinase
MTGNIWDSAVIVALGSNLGGDYGSSWSALNNALEGFSEIGLIVKAKSSVWRSVAWPDPSKPPYLNAVALVETALEPAELLAALHDLEARFGRRRTAVNESRVLDLDLIAYGRRVISTPELVLPHPRAAERLFVMGPLAEIAPDWRHPQTGGRADDLAASATVGRDAAPLPPGAFGVAQAGSSAYVTGF